MTEETLVPGHELQFCFSYLEVDDAPRAYDLSELSMLREVTWSAPATSGPHGLSAPG